MRARSEQRSELVDLRLWWLPEPEAPPKARHSARLLAGMAVVAVLAGLAGGVTGSMATRNVGDPPRPAQWPSGGSVDVAQVVARVEPAVVAIHVTTAFGKVTGSGLVVTADGAVLTNAHVVANSSDVTVSIAGTTEPRRAQVIAADDTADIALVRIDHASGLTVAPLASAAHVRVGDDVVTVGYSLALAGQPSVSRGIVSGIDRTTVAEGDRMTGLLQTDSPISSGNSGGALADSAGQVIGVTTAAAGGNVFTTAQNINFAIPTDTATGILRRFGVTVPLE